MDKIDINNLLGREDDANKMKEILIYTYIAATVLIYAAAFVIFYNPLRSKMHITTSAIIT
jgi:hypothetical protein